MSNLTEIVHRQSIIISEQSKTIYDLFLLLSQYMTQDEIDNLPQVSKLNQLAKLQE